MKEHLNDISRELQERNTNELTQQEKQENEKLYKKELTKTIKETIFQYFEEEQEKGKNKKQIYYELLKEEGDNLKDNITSELLNYSMEKQKKVALVGYNTANNKYKTITEKIFPFKDFDIFTDIEANYFKILKNIYNQLIEQEKINDIIVKEELKTMFDNIFKNFGYTKAKKLIYNQNIIETFTKRAGESEEEKKNILKNYVKIAKESEKNFLAINPQETTKTTRTSKNNKIKHSKTILFGSVIYGVFKGFAKASKN